MPGQIDVARVMLAERLAAFGRRGMALPAPLGVADSWFGDSKLMQHVRDAHQGTLLVEGKASYCFTLADGRQLKGHDLLEARGGAGISIRGRRVCATCGCGPRVPPMVR